MRYVHNILVLLSLPIIELKYFTFSFCSMLMTSSSFMNFCTFSSYRHQFGILCIDHHIMCTLSIHFEISLDLNLLSHAPVSCNLLCTVLFVLVLTVLIASFMIDKQQCIQCSVLSNPQPSLKLKTRLYCSLGTLLWYP